MCFRRTQMAGERAAWGMHGCRATTALRRRPGGQWERHWRRVDWLLVPSTVVVPQRAARTEWRNARFVDPAACRRAGMRPELVEAFERGFDMGFDRQPVLRPDCPDFYPSFTARMGEGLAIVHKLVADGYIEPLPEGVRLAV